MGAVPLFSRFVIVWLLTPYQGFDVPLGMPSAQDSQTFLGFPGVFLAFSPGLWKRKLCWSPSVWGCLCSGLWLRKLYSLAWWSFPLFLSSWGPPALRHFKLNSEVLKMLTTIIYWRILISGFSLKYCKYSIHFAYTCLNHNCDSNVNFECEYGTW